MEGLILAGAAFLAVSTLLHLLSILVATMRCARSRGAVPTGPIAANVTIIRPLCGVENFIDETLRSTFQLDYSHYEVLFCVASVADPVVPLVQRLIDEHPHIHSRLLIGDSRISANPKLNNMVKGWNEAHGDWILMADSNVLMPRDYIQRAFAAWRAGTGMVCSPPVGCAPDGVWAELECSILNGYQARWQCFADSAGFGFAQGKTMLWRRDYLAAATKLVRRAGLRIRLVGSPFEQPLGTRSMVEVWRRQIRWARLRRDTFPALFAIEIFAGGVPPLAVCAFTAAAADWPVVGVVTAFGLVWYGAEALLARAAGWHLSAASPAIWLLRDLVLPVIWFAGWAGNSFQWRGTSVRIAESEQSA